MTRKLYLIIMILSLASIFGCLAQKQSLQPEAKTLVKDWETLAKGMDYKKIIRNFPENREVLLHVFRIEQKLFNIKIHSFHSLPTDKRITIDQFREQNGSALIISGGFFISDFREPEGLVIEAGKIISPLSTKLSGVVWIKNRNIYLSETNTFETKTLQPEYALQGHPRLIDPINKIGIYNHDAIHHRAAICTINNFVLFIINDKMKSGMSLLELAEILQPSENQGGLGCDIAINLDGGPAPGISVDPQLLPLNISEDWQVPNAIVVEKF